MERNWGKAVFSFAVMLMLIISLVLPSQPAKAADIISVSEAIANNSGTKTVEGYIVAYTKGVNSYQFEPPFAADTNLAIADSPDERDKGNILPVQITSAFRAEFGLATNPDLIGKKVRITGALEAYFSVPGLKSPSVMQLIEGPEAPKAGKTTVNPAPGAVSKGTKVTMSTETEAATIYYTVDGSEPTTASSIYSEPIVINENTTIKAFAAAEGVENSDTETYQFYVAKDGLRIHDIQGKGHYSPYDNEYVAGVPGIVTYVVDNHNFYMQERIGDIDYRTSEGILVYKRNHGLQTGDAVKASGQVKEWVLEGYSDKLQTDLPVTEINASEITVQSHGNKLPTPVTINKLYKQPTKIIDNDQFSRFDPLQDGIDYYESLEGMLVNIENAKIIAPQKYGELYAVAGNMKTTTNFGGLLIDEKDYNPERIIIDIDDSNFIAKTGDSFKGKITGVVSYGFSNYRVLSKADELPTFVEGKAKQHHTTIKPQKDKLTIASYNIENFSSKTPEEKTNKLAQSIISNLKQPDIIGLIEVQDSDGATNSGNTDASGSYMTLINKIAELGGPEYAYTDIAPLNNQDGGAPGGNIRVGFIYNKERVQLADAPKGTATDAVGYDNGKLTLNPGRIDPANPVFASSRKPLAAQFTFNGEDVIVVANHFNSKGGDQPLFGKNQPVFLSSEEQRIDIAETVNGFVKDIKAKDRDANVVLLGDFNDFEFSAPLKALKGKELTNMIEKVQLKERYTYNYQGNAQVLDHILVSNNLAKQTQVDIVHLNSPFMEEHGRASD
ncbi:MAG: DUF6359 domain-containing protein, partial [Bacillus sp. (in: firmicutes)]